MDRSPVARSAPLSFAQQRLWLLEQVEPGGSTYHIPFAFRLAGHLDVGALRAALGEIVTRHGALRTSFVTVDDEPRQVIRPAAPFDLRVIDARFEADRDTALRRLTAEELERPMNLERDVLLSASAVRVGESEHVLLVRMHHIASDDWSRRVFVRELSALYRAFSRHEPPTLPPLPTQYVDYAIDQRRRLQGPELQRQRDYWRAQLAGLRPTELRPDRPRPPLFTPASGFCEVPLDGSLISRLKTIGREGHATHFMVLLAAFQALLARHCNTEDVAVGVPVANRNSLEVEPLIGFFVNTLVVRTDLSGDPTLRALVGRVRRVALAAYEHQEYPFEQIVADLRPPRDLSRNPLVQVAFNLVDRQHDPLDLEGLEAVEEPLFEDQAKFDLTAYAWPHGERPHLRMVYARDLFDHARIKDLLDEFVGLLQRAAAEPDAPLSSCCPAGLTAVRRASPADLPDPRMAEAGRPAAATEDRQHHESAVDGLEHGLARVWAEVLDVPRVGVHDNFFDLGGHSLLAARVILRAERLLGIGIPLRALFEAPTIAELAGRLRASGAEPGSTITQPGTPAQAPVADPPPAPLSFPQQRLWFLNALDPTSAAYHVSRAFELNGPLDEPALLAALTAIIDRHASLRTSFEQKRGELRQVVRPARAFPLRVIDLSAVASATRDAEVARRTSELALEPFDLERDLLIRASLLRLAVDQHVLLVTLHHITADGWSLEVFTRELTELYAAGHLGIAPSLPALPVQYADFSRWQRERLEGPRLDRLRDFWRRELEDLPALELPTDRARPARLSFQGAPHAFTVPASITAALGRIGRSENATLFMTVLAAFEALLGRHAGQRDFGVGTPVANRPLPEHDALIGFFANTLVIRADLSGDPTFRHLVSRVRRAALAAYEHYELPFEQLAADLGPARDLNRNPLVQVVFSLQDSPGPLSLAGLEVTERELTIQRSRFDLELHLRGEPDGSLRGSFIYATDLFADESAARLAGHFLAALETVAADPDVPLSRVSMIPDSERQLLLDEWNDTATVYPRDETLSTLFEAHVTRTPEAVAVVDGGRQVSYAELDSLAAAVAGQLRALGVEPGARVGLCLERSLELVAATLGVIKAGGAYVPLDPSDPPARIALMATDAAVPVVVTMSRLRASLGATGCRLLCLDEPQAVTIPDRAPAVSAGAPACVMYTSGSTGTPRGVLVPHRAIVRLVVNTSYVHLAPGDVMALAANPAFDASTFEIWGALANGARLVIVPPDVLLGPALPAFLREHRVTTMFLTTSLFNHIAREMPGALQPVRNLVFGGEAADAAAVRRILEGGRPGRLINGYGPTEATTFAVCHEVERCDPADRSVPIGRPIANTTAYVLDEAGALLPIGAPGELHVGGDALALGYLNEPALSAERFVPHPFRPGEQLYRTGDIARWRADGLLEYLGRGDGLVKLRGYRVELGEIEAVLAGHPAVAQCVVAAAGEDADKRLVAYVVLQRDQTADADALARHLGVRLPRHMIPASFVILAALPLTRNGKIDRRALPAPDVPEPVMRGRRPEAWTPTERRVARVWRDVLDLPDIGPDDNFFTLGGHSLLAVRLFGLLEDEFGVPLPLSQLFEHGTIRSLARMLDGSRPIPPWTPLVPIRPAGSEKPLFLVHGVGGEVLSFTNLALRLPAAVPVYGIRAPGPGSDHGMPHEISALAERYADLVASVEPDGPYYLGGFSSGAVTALEMAAVLRRRGRPVALLLLIDGGLPASVRPHARIRHTPASILRQMALWVVDDALATPVEHWWPRIGSKVRAMASRVNSTFTRRSANGHSGVDMRHRLGMWKFPGQYRALLAERLDAFERHVPSPYEGDIALVRSRTTRLFGPRPENLDEAWRALSRGSFSVTYVPGSHTSMLEVPRVDELARAVAACLDRARAAAERP